jgi:hypothetical protein
MNRKNAYIEIIMQSDVCAHVVCVCVCVKLVKAALLLNAAKTRFFFNYFYGISG